MLLALGIYCVSMYICIIYCCELCESAVVALSMAKVETRLGDHCVSTIHIGSWIVLGGSAVRFIRLARDTKSDLFKKFRASKYLNIAEYLEWNE